MERGRERDHLLVDFHKFCLVSLLNIHFFPILPSFTSVSKNTVNDYTWYFMDMKEGK